MHDGGLMRRQVVQHDVNLKIRFDALVEFGKKGDKVFCAVLLFAGGNHFAGGDVESSEEIERAVANVIVRAPFRLTEIHRQDRLRAFESLDLLANHGGSRFIPCRHRAWCLAQSDETVERLCTAPSVGPVTAAAFSSTVDDPSRFKSAHQVEAYLGLTPSEWSSGEKRSNRPRSAWQSRPVVLVPHAR